MVTKSIINIIFMIFKIYLTAQETLLCISIAFITIFTVLNTLLGKSDPSETFLWKCNPI